REAVTLAERDAEVKCAEIALKHGQKEGEIAAAELELATLERERQYAVLRSPIDGIVTTQPPKVGDRAELGKPILEIAAQGRFYFEVLVPSEGLGNLQVGMPARIRLDAYDYQRYGTIPGAVAFVSPDSVLQEGARTPFYRVLITVENTE